MRWQGTAAANPRHGGLDPDLCDRGQLCALIYATKAQIQDLGKPLALGGVQLGAALRAEGLDATIAALSHLDVVLCRTGEFDVLGRSGKHRSEGRSRERLAISAVAN